MAGSKYCQECNYPNPNTLTHCFKCKHDLSKPKGYEQQIIVANWKYFIVNTDDSLSAPYTFSELERMKNSNAINATTYILKYGDKEPKLAGALFDFHTVNQNQVQAFQHNQNSAYEQNMPYNQNVTYQQNMPYNQNMPMLNNDLQRAQSEINSLVTWAIIISLFIPFIAWIIIIVGFCKNVPYGVNKNGLTIALAISILSATIGGLYLMSTY